MARVETIRNMTFADEVAVDVVSRETYRQTNEERFANYTAAERLEQNVGYEALFTVDRGDGGGRRDRDGVRRCRQGLLRPPKRTRSSSSPRTLRRPNWTS